MRSVSGIIISAVFLLWFIASICGMIYVSRIPELHWLAPVILGQFFMAFGIIGFITMFSNSKRNIWIAVAAFIVGTALLILPLMHHYGNSKIRAFIDSHILTFVGTGFAVIGLCGLVGSCFGKKIADSKFTKEVQGVCVQLKSMHDSSGTTTYSPVYEVWNGGEMVKLCKDVYSNIAVPEIGETRTLYIDETDLSSFADPISDRAVRKIMYLVFVPFIALGIFLAVLSLLLN